MSEVVSLHKVFTPTAPARVAFVERDQVNNKLVNALQTPGKQIVVYGHSGSGKTTLLVNKLHQVYEGHLTSRCMLGMTFEQLILDAFDQLGEYYLSEHSSVAKSSRSAELVSTYASIQAKIQASHTEEVGQKSIRYLPPQLTPQNLARLIGASGCCWVVDDFHKISNDEKPKLSQLMKIFMDMSDEFPELKIIALGAVDTARQVVDYDHEMKNRVAEIRVDPMSEAELLELIAKGEAALNISMGTAVKAKVATYSAGLASVCHHLCLNICVAAGVERTCDSPFRVPDRCLGEAMKVYVEEASDSLKSSFDKALKKSRSNKYDNARLILRALADFDDNGAARADIHQKIKRSVSTFPYSNLEHYLGRLQQEEHGALLKFSDISNCYSFVDPFARVYAMVYLRESADQTPATQVDIADELQRLFELLAATRAGSDEAVRALVRTKSNRR